MIAFKEHFDKPSWREGQILLGGRKWNCTLGDDNQSSKGIYAKVKRIIHPKETRLDVLTDPVR